MKKKPARNRKGGAQAPSLPAPNPANKLWREVCSMEQPLTSIENFVNMLCYFSESLDDQDQGLAVQELLFGIKGHLGTVKATRGRLFHAMHPAPELGRRMRARAKRREAANG